MSVLISNYQFKSKNRVKTFSFYSFLFDSDISQDHNGVDFLDINGVKFYFDENYSNNLISPMFSFILPSEAEFKNFKNKVNLAFYKEGAKAKILKDTPHCFEFNDLDDNPLRIEYLSI